MHRPSTKSVTILTVALGFLTAVTITAGPATAPARAETGRPPAVLGSLPVDAAKARLPLGGRRLFASLATGFDAVHDPVVTLGKTLVGKGRLRAGARDLLPGEVVEFFDQLTDEDRRVLGEVVASHGDFETEEQTLDALKAKSEKLYNKAVEVRDLLKGKLAALNPAAKTFVDQVVAEIKALKPKGDERPSLTEISKKAREVLEQYRALPAEARESLKTNFPRLAAIIEQIRDRRA